MALMLKPKTFERGDVIAPQGALAPHVTLLLDGEVRWLVAPARGGARSGRAIEVATVVIGSTIELVGGEVRARAAAPASLDRGRISRPSPSVLRFVCAARVSAAS